MDIGQKYSSGDKWSNGRLIANMPRLFLQKGALFWECTHLLPSQGFLLAMITCQGCSQGGSDELTVAMNHGHLVS